MRGLLFTELVEWIETQYSPVIADAILTMPGLTAGGAYTGVGVYEYREFDLLLERLVARVGDSRSSILLKFGRFHFHKLLRLYPHLVTGVHDTFSLLERVDHPIHSTVVSLHPHAEVPRLVFERLGKLQARLTYQSPRRLVDIAEGLVMEAAAHYGEEMEIKRTELQSVTSDHIGEQACFLLTKTQAH